MAVHSERGSFPHYKIYNASLLLSSMSDREPVKDQTLLLAYLLKVKSRKDGGTNAYSEYNTTYCKTSFVFNCRIILWYLILESTGGLSKIVTCRACLERDYWNVSIISSYFMRIC